MRCDGLFRFKMMFDKDLTIDGEEFKTIEDYYYLTDRIWIHNSLGGNITISNCRFNNYILTSELVMDLNERLGFTMFREI